jgi:hypothetical protein
MKTGMPFYFSMLMLVITMACKPGTTETDATDDSVNDSVALDGTEVQPPDSAAMMKAWETFMTPGDMHTWMAKWNGTWEADVKSYMDPDGPPAESKATVEIQTIMNGLYQITNYSGNMLGMPFEGRGTLAYDNSKKQFINTWIDNLGSGIMIMTGTWDESKKMMTLSGHQTDPLTGKDSPVRQELTFPDDNTQIFVMYGAGMDGKEIKYMDSTMKRKS